jgi:hypothetical protein
MKRALLTCGTLAVAFMLPTLAHGQSTVNVSATVNPIITPGTITHMSFGAANPGAEVIISPLATPSQGTRGELPVTHNTPFQVSAVVTPLTNGTTPIAATYHCAYTTTSGGTVGQDATTATTLCTALPNRTTNTGTTYIMIGGTVTIPAGAAAGAYNGSIAFTITAPS